MLLTSGGLRPRKSYTRRLHFLSVLLVCTKHLTVSYEVGIPPFWLWLCPLSNLPKFSGPQNPLPTHLWVRQRDHGDSLYTIGVGSFYVFRKKRKNSLFVWPGAAHAPIRIWTNNCIPCNNRFIPNFVQIGRHLGKWRPKNLFVTHNRGRPGLWDMAVKEKTGIRLSENRQIPPVDNRMFDAYRRQLVWRQLQCSTGRSSILRSGGISHSLIDDSTPDVTQSTSKKAEESRATSAGLAACLKSIV